MRADTNGSPAAEQARGARESGEAEAASSEPRREAGHRGLLASIVALADEAATFARAQFELFADRRRLAFRRLVIQAALGVALGVVVIAWLSAGAVAVVRGVSGGLAVLFGGRAWAGDLVGGAAVLALVALAAWFVKSRMAQADLRRLEAKYERLLERHGEDAGAVARPAGGKSPPAHADRDATTR